MRARFGQLSSILEHLAEILMRPARGRNGRGMSPQRFRVAPDPDLLPGERGEAEHDERARPHDQRSGPRRLTVRARSFPPGPREPGATEHGPTEKGQVG